MELLDRIDRAVNGECPCGTEPREGSAYCSDDCTPTHISDDTDTRMSGDYATAMRWRPDLVTAYDDANLDCIGSGTYVHTGHNTTIYRNRATGRVHLRLDDGNRFVGMDITEGEAAGPFGPLWQRLARELTDSRRTEPDDPWADVTRSILPPGLAWRRIPDEDPFSTGQRLAEAFIPRPATMWDSASSDPLADVQRVRRQQEAFVGAFGRQMSEAVRAAVPAFARATEAFRRLAAAVPDLQSACDEQEPPPLAAIEARRNRNTGPERRRRAPRQISPRRSR